jgi:hypothetical protein
MVGVSIETTKINELLKSVKSENFFTSSVPVNAAG